MRLFEDKFVFLLRRFSSDNSCFDLVNLNFRLVMLFVKEGIELHVENTTEGRKFEKESHLSRPDAFAPVASASFSESCLVFGESD